MAIQPTNRSYELSTPNKLFEAFAAGVPVAGSDFPGCRTIVLDNPEGPLGELCDPTSPASIGAAIRRILELPRAEYERDGVASSFGGDRALELGDRIGPARRALRPAGRRVTEPGRDPAGERAAIDAAIEAASRVRQACTLVLPTNGAFDSRAWRIASTLAARGHDVTVLARSEAGLPDREDHPAGYRIVRVPVSAVAGLPWPLRPLVAAGVAGAARACARCGGRGVAVGEASPRVPVAPARIARVRRAISAASGLAAIALTTRSQRLATRPLAPHADLVHAMAYMGIPIGARPGPPRRGAGRLRRPRHLRRRRATSPGCRRSPVALFGRDRAALGAPRGPRRDRQRPYAEVMARRLGAPRAARS